MKDIAVYVDGAVFKVGQTAVTTDEAMGLMFDNRAVVDRIEHIDLWDNVVVVFNDGTRVWFPRQKAIVQSKDEE